MDTVNLGVASVIKTVTLNRKHRGSGSLAECNWAVGARGCWSISVQAEISVHLDPSDGHAYFSLFSSTGGQVDKLEYLFYLVHCLVS